MPRLRTARYAMPAATARIARSMGSVAGLSSISAWVVAAPAMTLSRVDSMPRNASTDDMSTSVPGRARRRFSIGPRDWPPPMSFAPSPLAARRSTASSTLAARW